MGLSIQGASIFGRIARIAASVADSPVALVTLRQNKKLSVLGSSGAHLATFDENWANEAVLVRRQTMSYVKNVRSDPNFKNHPLFTIAPFMRSLVHVPSQVTAAEFEASITVINPKKKWPFSAPDTSVLNDLAMLVSDAMNAAIEHKMVNFEGRAPRTSGLHETSGEMVELGQRADTAGKFLLSTLVKRTSIRSRNDISYVTLRTWSSAIKDHQKDALRIVKATPDAAFVKFVAQEIAQHTRKMFGKPPTSSVVPVPCGHSRSANCLSVQIAKALAEILDQPYVEAFAHEPREGVSHPRKSVKLVKPKLIFTKPLPEVLLVDDVASSGRHLELAIQSLREASAHVTAIAWIGAR